MKRLALVVACSLVASAAGAKKNDTPVDPGPPPSNIEVYRQLAQAAILQGFFDPGSAQFQWDRGITGGYWKPPLQGKIAGWFTCGLVNGKNRMGGYVGFRRFVVVERNGTVVFSAVGDGGNFDFVELGCQKSISSGVLPVAASGSVAATPIVPPLNPNAPRLGIGYKVVPEGIGIFAIEKGGAAEKAGLKVGMVVSHVNGIPVAGFDETTIAKMLRAATGEITFTVVGHGDIKVTKPQKEFSA